MGIGALFYVSLSLIHHFNKSYSKPFTIESHDRLPDIDSCDARTLKLPFLTRLVISVKSHSSSNPARSLAADSRLTKTAGATSIRSTLDTDLSRG